MNRKIIRSPVHVGTNNYGGVHGITEQYGPDTPIKRVNLVQAECWWEGAELRYTKREVWIESGRGYTKGEIVPGNIVMCYSLEPIGEYPEDYLTYSEKGLVTNLDGNPVYHYTTYLPESEYQPEGILQDDDDLQEFIEDTQLNDNQ